MKKLSFLAILILFNSCAMIKHDFVGETNKITDQYDLQHTKNKKSNYGKVIIEYKNYQTAIQDIKASSKNELLSLKETNRLLKETPKGGFIFIRIFRTTIGMANTDIFKFILKHNNKNIYNKNGDNNVPSTPSHYGADGAYWTNITVIPISKSFTQNDKLQLFVIDKATNGRDEFILTYSINTPNKGTSK